MQTGSGGNDRTLWLPVDGRVRADPQSGGPIESAGGAGAGQRRAQKVKFTNRFIFLVLAAERCGS